MGATRANPTVRHRLTAAAVLATGIVLVGCSPAPGTANVATPQPSTAAPPSATATATAAAHDRDPGARRLHRDHGAPAERGDVPLPHVGRQVPHRLRPGADQRLPRPGDDRAGSTSSTPPRPATVLASYSGTALVDAGLPVRRLQPAAPAALGPGDRHRHPAAGVTRAVRRLHLRLPRQGPEGRPPPPLRHGRDQPGLHRAGPRRLPRRAARHRGRHAAGHRPAGEGRPLGRAQRVLPAGIPPPHLARHAQREARQRPAVRHRLEAGQRERRVLHRRPDEERELRRLRRPHLRRRGRHDHHDARRARPEPAGRPARRRPRPRTEDHGRDRRRQPHRRRTSAAAPTRSTPTCRRAPCSSSRATGQRRAR